MFFPSNRKIHREKMKLVFLLGLLSVTMAMGKTAELPEMAKLEMAEESRDQVSCIQG